jgi:nitrite reductase/ring-hydroxylating ferredoxin subunit
MKSQPRVYELAPLSDFPVGTHRVYQIENREIGVFNVQGKFYGLPNLCPHQLGPLCKGVVSGTLDVDRENDWKLLWTREGEIVTCPWHGMEYDIPTGQCLAYPEIRLRSYEILVEDGVVKLKL